MKKVYVLLFIVLGVITYILIQDKPIKDLFIDTEQETHISQEKIDAFNMFSSIDEDKYTIYYEETLYLYGSSFNSIYWMDVIYQDSELYELLKDSEVYKYVTFNTDYFIKENNKTSLLYIEYDDGENPKVIRKVPITYYDIKSDTNYENGGHYIASNGNEYNFDIFNDNYFVIYELLDNTIVYSNYYYYFDEDTTFEIEEGIYIEIIENRLGLDFAINDQNEVTKFHYIFPDYDSSRSCFFLNTRNYAYITLDFGTEYKYDLVSYEYNEGKNQYSISLKIYSEDQILLNDTFILSNFLEHKIDDSTFEYEITYQKLEDDLINIVFRNKDDNHIMSYIIRPNN